MGIDSLKAGISSLVSKVEQKVEQTVAEVKTAVAPPPPPPPAPKEEFVDTAKKPMSITGKHTAFQPASGSVRSDLSASVSNVRLLANSGLAANVIGASGKEEPAPANLDALKAAIGKKSDSGIRDIVNKDPSILKSLSPAEKGAALEALRSGWTSGDDKKAMLAIVRSCESKGELRAVMSAATGVAPDKLGSEQFHKFDKQLTDTHPFLIADLLNPANTSLKENHPQSVSENDQIGDTSKFPSPDGKTVDLNDPASRKAFVEGLTQVDSTRKGQFDRVSNTGFKFKEDDDPRQYGCGPTCILASALQGNDPKGSLLKLIDYDKAHLGARNGTTVAESQGKQLDELKDKINKGTPLTRQDFDVLQKATYEAAREAEKKFPDAKTDNGPIDARAIKAVLVDSGVGTSGGVPKLIDTDRVPTKDGKMTSEHFVLEKDGAIYDPWPRRDGKQTVPAGSDAAKRYQASFIND
ncbi:MAG: hypothetical protein U0228_15045 [Myxococcaceae bacterium]